jgi:hypothetical protein
MNVPIINTQPRGDTIQRLTQGNGDIVHFIWLRYKIVSVDVLYRSKC